MVNFKEMSFLGFCLFIFVFGFVSFETLPLSLPQWQNQFGILSTVNKEFPFPHPHQHLLSVVFLILAILIVVMWNLKVVLIGISLIAKDDEHV